MKAPAYNKMQAYGIADIIEAKPAYHSGCSLRYSYNDLALSTTITFHYCWTHYAIDSIPIRSIVSSA